MKNTKKTAKTRAEALALGFPRYVSATTCKRGHFGERYAADGQCVVCRREVAKGRSIKRWEKMTQEQRASHRAYCRRYRLTMTPEQHETKRKSRLASSRRRNGLPEPIRPAPTMCEMCGGPPNGRQICLDHCHETGAFRGWLCNRCNIVLGAIGDDRASLIKWSAQALAYLDNVT